MIGSLLPALIGDPTARKEIAGVADELRGRVNAVTGSYGIHIGPPAPASRDKGTADPTPGQAPPPLAESKWIPSVAGFVALVILGGIAYFFAKKV